MLMVHLSSKPVSWLILYLTSGKQVPLLKIKEQVDLGLFSILIFSNMANIVANMSGKKTLAQHNFLTLAKWRCIK